jgi:hypothetical protein
VTAIGRDAQTGGGATDWVAWHQHYEEPGSSLARRLEVVQDRIRDALDRCPPGPLRVLSMCAGQGRDLLGVLTDHPRRTDAAVRLVEIDPHNAQIASATAAAAGLACVEVVVADAGLTGSYAGAVPADLVLACGVFGNITNADIERTVSSFLPQLCATGATVIWTRGRWAPDMVPTIGGWLAERGFSELWVSDPGESFGVGAHRYGGQPAPLSPGERMFAFVGRADLATT